MHQLPYGINNTYLLYCTNNDDGHWKKVYNHLPPSSGHFVSLQLFIKLPEMTEYTVHVIYVYILAYFSTPPFTFYVFPSHLHIANPHHVS